MKLFKSFITISLFIFFISLNAFAQQSGSIAGQVFDDLGAVIPSANVTVIDSTGKEKTIVANAQGQFTVSGLAPGKYTVRVNSAKFSPYENTEVEVTAGKREELTIALVVAAAQETVDVSTAGQVTTDPENNAGATVLKDKDLDALPDDPDELEAALQALAGPSAGPNGGQFYIDGFTGGRLPPKEAIREIRINQNPFSAEYDRLGFGRVEILTKPGSDRWRGQAYFNFNDESLNSRNPFAANRASTQTRFFGGNVSGPVKKGKSSFFLDISNRQIDNSSVINALVLNSAFNIVPFQQDFTVPTRRFSVSPRFDYQLNKNNTLVARYSFTRTKAANQGIGGFSLPSRVFASSSTEHNIQLTETMILNPKTVNETRFQYEYNNRQSNGDNTIPTINVSSAFTGGGAQNGLNFTRSNRFELQNYTTTSLGKKSEHAVKFGVRLRSINIKDQSQSGYGGTFTFNGFAAVADPYDLDNNGFVSSIEQYRAKVLGATDARYNPSQFSITAGNPLASVSQTDLGLFITDDWRVRQDLTLSFGLRYENQTNIKDNGNFAPRFTFAWSPGAGGAKQPKTVIRGGAGVFYDRFGENYTLGVNHLNGLTQQQYIVPVGSAILSQPIFSANGMVTNVPTAAQLAAFAPLTNTIRSISPDLQAPVTYQGAIGVERQLPYKTTLSVNFIASRNIHVLRFRNINAPVCGLISICANFTPAQLQPLRPNPATGNIYQYESSGFLNQRQLIANFSSRLNPKFTLFGNYRLGSAKGNAEGGGFFGGGGVSFPAYSYDLSGEYGRSSIGVRHVFVLGGSFTMPWNVRLNPFIIASSGVPFNITLGRDLNGDSVFTERPTFAQLATGCQRFGITKSWCDTSGQDPNAVIPRNYGVGPGSLNVNLNISKTFGFGGKKTPVAAATTAPDGTTATNSGNGRGGRGGNRGGGGNGGGRGGFGGGGFGGGSVTGGGGSDNPYNLTFAVQVSNLFNRTNLGIPVGNLNSPFFGQSVSTGGGFGFFGGGGGGANRRIELQTRFSW